MNQPKNNPVNEAPDPAPVSNEKLAAQGDGQSGLVGRELDAAVAERVMGLKQCAWWSVNGAGKWSHSATEHGCYPGLWRDEQLGFTASHPAPTIFTSDTASTMEVVQKMLDSGYEFDLIPPEDGKYIVCSMNQKGDQFWERGTLPEAICRAALAAVVHNEEGKE